MSWWLRVLAALVKDLDSIPAQQLVTVCNSNAGNSTPASELHMPRCALGTQTYMGAKYSHTQNKTSSSKK